VSSLAFVIYLFEARKEEKKRKEKKREEKRRKGEERREEKRREEKRERRYLLWGRGGKDSGFGGFQAVPVRPGKYMLVKHDSVLY
jgi:hypothetical protein